MQTAFSNKVRILKYLHSLPEYNNCKIEDVVDGVSTEVYRLITTAAIYYLRISADQMIWNREAEVYNTLQQLQLHTPKLVLKGQIDKLLFLITTEIKGKPIVATTENVDVVLEAAGTDLAKLNSVTIDTFGYLDNSPFDTYSDFLFDDFEDKLQTVINLGFIENIYKRKLLELKKRYSRLARHIEQAYLSHGDMGCSHIYEDNGTYSGIIDFGDIRGTSQFHDLSHFYIYEGKEKFNSLLSGFKKIVRLPDDWQDYLNMEILSLGISKTFWMSQKHPEMLSKSHPAFLTLKKLVAESLD